MSIRLREARIAPSQEKLCRIGEYPIRCTPGGVGTVPDGSKSNVAPSRRLRDINDTTSFFVDVTTQERVVIRRFGTTMDDVFPLRLGPSTSVERSSPLVASPRTPRPK